MKKLIAIFVLVALLLIGCGGNKNETEAPETDAPTTEPSSTEAPETEAPEDPVTEGLKYTLLADDTYVVSIGKASDCTNIFIPSHYDGKPVTKIATSGFFEANAVSVVIPNTVTEIGDYAFECCTSLTDVTIPDSVTKIGTNAFSGCTSLTNINVDENNLNYSSENGILFDKNKTQLLRFIKGKNTTTYTIPNSVTEIADFAFESCANLTGITIPDSVTLIGGSAFYGCTSLTDITLPNSIKTIEGWAFVNCTSLNSIKFEGTAQQWESIEKGYYWNDGILATVVVCADGEVSIK